jgi:molybdopterin adenylyltransferase
MVGKKWICLFWERIWLKLPLRFGILTTSDRSARGERQDETSPGIEAEIKKADWQVLQLIVVPDEFTIIRDTLMAWVNKGDVDIILTTGGTGFSPRDITPEATLAVIERKAPGLAESMRAESMAINPHAMLSRGVAGICRNVLIINLPGSPRAAIENFKVIQPVLAHAVELIKNDPEAEKHHLTKG